MHASQNMDSSKLSKLVKVAIANLDALVGMHLWVTKHECQY